MSWSLKILLLLLDIKETNLVSGYDEQGCFIQNAEFKAGGSGGCGIQMEPQLSYTYSQ